MNVKISVETPLIIGGSDDILEYDFLNEADNICLIDFEATASRMSDTDAEKWQSLVEGMFALKGKPNMSIQGSGSGRADDKRSRFIAFYEDLKKRGILKFYGNKISCSSPDFWKYGSVTPTIHYVSIGTEGKVMVPYIPGSTIKGTLRRSILFRLIKGDQGLTMDGSKVRPSDLLLSLNGDNGWRGRRSFSDSKIFSLSKKPTARNDAMRLISVSDFLPSGNFDLGIVQLRRKTKGKDLVANYLAITGGNFTGEISINLSMIHQFGAMVSDESTFFNLSKIFGLSRNDFRSIGEGGSSLGNVESRVVSHILDLVDDYSRINGGELYYSIAGSQRRIILGYGKGAPLTTVNNANDGFKASALDAMQKVRTKNRERIIQPTSHWYAEFDHKQLRPGQCTIEVME